MVITNVFSSWTKPTTQEQIDFFSIHYDERKAYLIGALIIQCFWALCDLPAFIAILLSIANYVPLLLYFYLPIAVAIVFALHFILKATLKTSLHYMLQDAKVVDGVATGLKWQKAKTPIFIAVVLFSCSTAGLYVFERQNGYKANLSNNDNSALLKEHETINNTYASMELSVEKSAKAKESADLSVLDRKIAILKAKKPINNWHKGVIANDLAEAKAKRNKWSAKIEKEKAIQLDSLTAKKTATLLAASNRFEKQSNFLASLNDSEIAKQQVSENFGSKYSWIISFLMMLLFFGSQTRLSTINFKSGIFPTKEFDDNDVPFIEVVNDIVGSRWTQIKTLIHEHGSVALVKKPDGARGFEESNYNASRLRNNAESLQEVAETQLTASENATEAENAEAVITAAQQEAERLQQIETERIATEKAVFETEKQRLVDEIAAFEAKQREAKAEEERQLKARLAELEQKEKVAEAARLKEIETAKQLELQKAQQERNRTQQLEREKQEREAKAQQEREAKDEANRVAQQLLQEKLAASDTAKEKIEKIRTDLSNLRHNNGTTESVTKRLDEHFRVLLSLNAKKLLTDKDEKKLATRWEEYQTLLKEKEVTND